MVSKITEIVNECLEKYVGGTPFFNAIDEKLRFDKSMIDLMISEVIENEEFDYIIVSGKFGLSFEEHCHNYYNKEFNKKIIVINGGLRKDNVIIPFWENFNIEEKKIVFIDDSYYLGRTRDKIKMAIEEKNGTLINTYVFYDGSKTKDDSVKSFYRYYDFHEIN